MSKPPQTDERKVVVTNRKAQHDYFIEETFEAGIALKGTEVKSLRLNQANLQDSYAAIRDGSVWLVGMHINQFEKGNINNHDPKRERRLLLHKREIRRLKARVVDKGLTLVPISVYFVKNIAKIELAVARGKKSYDKRETIAKRDAEREIRRRNTE
ncbi:MAG: SsrA-binding protein SmpB [Ignavibacteriae bacterium]|nr:SsrA-binding protein SmpB [Ignavibacteriota bacterium]